MNLGTDRTLDNLKANMDSVYECREVGRIGPEDGDGKVLKVLNRIV